MGDLCCRYNFFRFPRSLCRVAVQYSNTILNKLSVTLPNENSVLYFHSSRDTHSIRIFIGFPAGRDLEHKIFILHMIIKTRRGVCYYGGNIIKGKPILTQWAGVSILYLLFTTTTSFFVLQASVIVVQ